MPTTRIDHLVITAPTLAAGAAYIEQTLGATPTPGGEHPRMGTHNLLLRLGERLYLEVIAINPEAPSPGRPRWFGLDSLTPDSHPALSAWVARTTDIDNHALAASESLGAVEAMQRGERNWRITIPGDGLPVLGGCAPSLIEWEGASHPADTLPDHGLVLASLAIHIPAPEHMTRLLASLDCEGPPRMRVVGGERTGLVAHVDTPNGRRMLSGRS